MTGKIKPRLRSIWKYLLSFRKRDWRLADYPVTIRRQFPSEADTAYLGRLKLPAFVARIENWHLCGTGETEEEAREDLRRKFDSACKRRSSLPRPGTHVPIEFAPRDRIAANLALTDEFISSILGLEEVWISDESSLWDFSLGAPIEEYIAKIRSHYGIDVTDIPGANLAEILERIAQSREKQRLETGEKS